MTALGQNQHHSISLLAQGNPLQLVQCQLVDCPDCSSLERKLYHCPLCRRKFRLRSRLKEHHTAVHWESRISFGDYNMLKCKNTCRAVATRKDTVIWDKPHYHCFGCSNLFNKSRALLHYTLHTVQTHQLDSASTAKQMQINTTQEQHLHSRHETPATTLQQTEQPVSPPAYIESDSPLEVTIHNIGPSATVFSRSLTDRVACPYCSKEFHPHSLKYCKEYCALQTNPYACKGHWTEQHHSYDTE